MPGFVKRVLLGNPLRTEEHIHQRLGKSVALAVFSSDALSSVAYATEEILLVLVLAGTAALRLGFPIALGIATLLVIVAISYRQTIRAYPGGGGAYIVAKENLGRDAGLIAGGALLVDYILTVAVSVSAGTAAITSAFPAALPFRVEIAVALTALLALANLRGVRESGALFAGPTYLFIFMLGLLIVMGLARFAFGMPFHVTPHGPETAEAVQGLTLFLILRAFASGCTAMTGIEAIANGVQAFKSPEAQNARTTLTWMAGILLFMFVGTSALATLAQIHPAQETVMSQLGRGVFGTGALYYVLQAATAAILVLAANTSYADFPRLGSFMAHDGYLPKQLQDRGQRLVYSNGIILLTAVSMVLLVIFRGDTHRLIPLYAVGVFTSFTLSQSGMVLHWLRLREEGWQHSALLNGVGAVATFVVLIVIGVTKFSHGAWIVILLIPILVTYFRWVRAHYDDIAERLRLSRAEAVRLNWRSVSRLHNHIVLLVAGVDRRLLRALQYAKTLKADEVEAVFVDTSGGEEGDKIRKLWELGEYGIKLTVIESPYREIVEPLKQFVGSMPRPTEDYVITVILPEYVPESAVDNLLHNQTAFFIKGAMFDMPGVVVVDVPYHLSHERKVMRTQEPQGI